MGATKGVVQTGGFWEVPRKKEMAGYQQGL